MKRRIALISIAVLLVCTVGVVSIMLHTGFALHWTLGVIQDYSAGALQIGAEDGTLAGPITLHDVRIKTAGFDARIKKLTIAWLPAGLLINRLHITSLAADDVALSLTPASGTTPFHLSRPVPPHLPLILVISKLTVNGMRVSAPQLAQPVQIAHLSSMMRFDNHSWRMPELLMNGPQLHVQGHGNWDFRNGEQLDAALNWKLNLPQQPPFSGQAVIKGDDRQLHLGMGLQAPMRMQFDAEVRNLFNAPAWQGKMTLTQVLLPDVVAGMPDIKASGEAHFSGTPAGTDFTGDMTAHEPDTGDWRGQFALRYQHAQLQVRQLQLARAATRTRFELKGTINLAGAQVSPDLEGEWQTLPLPLAGKPWLESPRGTLRVQSKASHITLSLDGALAGGGKFTAQGSVDMGSALRNWQLAASAHNFHLTPGALSRPLPGFDWRLLARGDIQHTLIDNLTVNGFGGNLHMRGDYQHGGTHNWHATVSARHLNPGVLFPVYQGDLGFEAQLSGNQGAVPRCMLTLKSLQGTLRAAPVSGSGSVQCAQGQWLFRNVKLRVADNRIEFNGHLGRQTHFEWNVQAPELAVIWPGLSGRLDSRGSLVLAGSNPVARFSLHAANLRYQDYSIATLDTDVAMSNTSQAGTAALKAGDVVINGTSITTLSAHLSGSLDAHVVQLALSSPLGEATISGNGKLANDVWQGELSSITLEPAGAGTWQAAAAWQPRIGANGISLPQACMVQVSARACVNASWHQHKWQASATLEAIPLSDLQALLPPGLEYAGSFAGTLQSSGDANHHQIDLTASLSPGSIHNVIRHQRVALLDYTHGDAHIHIDTTHTTGSLNWSLRDGGYLNLDTRIAHGDNPALRGRIRGELHDFALIPALIPDVSGFEGKLKINLALGGSAGNPTFNGTATLTDGAIRAPRLGLNVSGVVLSLEGNGQHLVLNGTAQSGTGNLTWDSTAQKRNGVWHATGHLNGKDFRVADIPEAQVDISPALDFRLDDRDITLDGKVDIPYAKLRPRNLSNTAQVSVDQVIVGQNEAAQRDRWRIHARVLAGMGDKVDIQGFGLSGRITGSVQMVDEPGQFTTGSGELQIVDGQYTAYGQKLGIDRGRLMFNGGPVSNPALDIRAIRKPAHPETVVPGQSEQQVGVVVRGTLRDPNVSLFANPPLPQSSLLSYLLTGQLPATPSQSPLLGQPITDTGDALTYSGGEFLAQQVGSQIGISDVSIQNVSTGIGTSTPSLFIGKYLSPRLYVSYGAGILQSINTIRIRYTLSTKWMLEAESGATNSADLIYTLEH